MKPAHQEQRNQKNDNTTIEHAAKPPVDDTTIEDALHDVTLLGETDIEQEYEITPVISTLDSLLKTYSTNAHEVLSGAGFSDDEIKSISSLDTFNRLLIAKSNERQRTLAQLGLTENINMAYAFGQKHVRQTDIQPVIDNKGKASNITSRNRTPEEHQNMLNNFPPEQQKIIQKIIKQGANIGLLNTLSVELINAQKKGQIT